MLACEFPIMRNPRLCSKCSVNVMVAYAMVTRLPRHRTGGVEFRGAPDNVYDSLLETKRRVLYGLHPPEGIRSRYLLQFFLVVQVDDNHRLWPVKAGEIRDVDKGCASAVDRLIRHDLHTNPSKRVSPRIITLPGFAQHRARFAGPSHPIPVPKRHLSSSRNKAPLAIRGRGSPERMPWPDNLQ